MPQGELWKATPRDKLRAEAARSTPSGQILAREIHDLCMQSLDIRIAKGTYTPTAEDLKNLEEWRKEKAQQEAPSAE